MLYIIWNKKNTEKQYGKRGVKSLKKVLNEIKGANVIDSTPEDLSDIVFDSEKEDSFHNLRSGKGTDKRDRDQADDNSELGQQKKKKAHPKVKQTAKKSTPRRIIKNDSFDESNFAFGLLWQTPKRNILLALIFLCLRILFQI